MPADGRMAGDTRRNATIMLGTMGAARRAYGIESPAAMTRLHGSISGRNAAAMPASAAAVDHARAIETDAAVASSVTTPVSMPLDACAARGRASPIAKSAAAVAHLGTSRGRAAEPTR